MMPDDPPRLLVWGLSGHGKSTLLSRLFSQNIEFPTIANRVELFRAAGEGVTRAQTGRLLEGTTDDVVDYPITLSDGRKAILSDMAGGFCQRTESPERRQLLHETAGILFVVPWDMRFMQEAVNHMSQPLGALDSNQAAGVAFTMCEQQWAHTDGAWNEAETLHRKLRDKIETQPIANSAKIGLNIWLTSAFGYTPDGDPGAFLDEFGRLRPIPQAKPCGIAEPLESMLDQVAK